MESLPASHHVTGGGVTFLADYDANGSVLITHPASVTFVNIRFNSNVLAIVSTLQFPAQFFRRLASQCLPDQKAHGRRTRAAEFGAFEAFRFQVVFLPVPDQLGHVRQTHLVSHQRDRQTLSTWRAKFIDELGADAVTIKQLNEAVEISVPVVEKYCDYALGDRMVREAEMTMRQIVLAAALSMTWAGDASAFDGTPTARHLVDDQGPEQRPSSPLPHALSSDTKACRREYPSARFRRVLGLALPPINILIKPKSVTIIRVSWASRGVPDGSFSVAPIDFIERV